MQRLSTFVVLLITDLTLFFINRGGNAIKTAKCTFISDQQSISHDRRTSIYEYLLGNNSLDGIADKKI